MILNSVTGTEFWAGHLGARGWVKSVMCLGFHGAISNSDKLSASFKNC